MALLRELGVRTLEDRTIDGKVGFPVAVPLADGGSLVLDMPFPAFLAALNPEALGVAILDPLGYVRTSWGLARRVPAFKPGQSVLESPIAGLMEGSYQGGQGALYLDGYRYFSAGLSSTELTDVFVLVVNAQEERQVRKQASKSWRMANALKRLGKTLTMNQTMAPLCVAAAHEIASTAELASVLLWTHNPDDGTLELAASVGANRLGTNALNRLSTLNGAGCAAELVASTRQSFRLMNVVDNVLTANLEAKFCYLKPGGLSVHPLVISDRLLGVLEIIGREDDAYFEENEELFQTIAEHLALALNSAAMFENFEQLATRDPLTGLSNHRAMHEFLHQRLLEAERTGQELGIIMLDVDHFRSFNEEEGHDAGDDVLRLVGEALKSCLRPYDLAARYGGEEFTIVMPGSSHSGVVAAAERMRKKISSVPYTTRSGRERGVTASFGCAVFPSTAKDAGGLLKAADVALYEAKHRGRDRVVLFEGQLSSIARPQGVPPDSIYALLPEDEVVAARDRLHRLALDMDALSTSLKLSDSQRSILEALLLVAPYYTGADAQHRAALDQTDHFRLLTPSLESYADRFDAEEGNRIPLLARILAVLLELDKDGGRNLMQDPTRYDPEIVSLVAELNRAA